jgi:hypothetical protein
MTALRHRYRFRVMTGALPVQKRTRNRIQFQNHQLAD